jgi:hypothetical protein
LWLAGARRRSDSEGRQRVRASCGSVVATNNCIAVIDSLDSRPPIAGQPTRSRVDCAIRARWALAGCTPHAPTAPRTTMELELHRHDLLHTNSAARGALAVSRPLLCASRGLERTCKSAGPPGRDRTPPAPYRLQLPGCAHAGAAMPRAGRPRGGLAPTAAPPTPPQVLPPGEKKTQKVAVGDLTGVLQCISIKKGDVSTAFKTLPSQAKARNSVDAILSAIRAAPRLSPPVC